MEFNNKLYNLRKQKGFSQEELANRLNVSRQTVSKWELGDSTPDMEKLIAISDLFEVSLDEAGKGQGAVEYRRSTCKVRNFGSIKAEGIYRRKQAQSKTRA